MQTAVIFMLSVTTTVIVEVFWLITHYAVMSVEPLNILLTEHPDGAVKVYVIDYP